MVSQVLHYIAAYLTIVSLARVGVLLFVLVADFGFRRFVYGRSDPLSFSLLSFSFLLVASDSFLRILQGYPSNDQLSTRGLIAGLVYLALFFVVFALATLAHQGYKLAQEENIQSYLRKLLPKNAEQTATREVLEKLATTMIEPDAFEILPAKKKKRIEYIKAVEKLTGTTLDPVQEQGKLLVGKSFERFWARVGYIGSFVFGLASTLYFFAIR